MTYNYLKELIKTLSTLIPNDSDSCEEIGGYKISTSNRNGNISITVESVEQKFDDTEIKELVSNYKENIGKLDDCLFLDVLEEIKDHLDIKTFDELTNQDSYSEEDAEIVKSMINFTNLVVHENIVNKIQDLEELLTKF